MISYSSTEVCNLALADVGGATEARRIDDFDTSAGNIPDLCREFYHQTFREVLQRFEWLDALAYDELSELAAGSQIDAAEWEYQFQLPGDCLLFLRQVDEDDHETTYECAVRRQANGKLILLTNEYSDTDGDKAYIEYLRNEQNMGVMMPLFVRAFATLLASYLASALNPTEADRLRLRYEQIDLPIAKAADRRQVHVEKGSYSWRDARTDGVS